MRKSIPSKSYPISMTDKQIKNLILTGEGYHIEFKKTLDKSLVEEVCAFANSSGGYVLIGVNDDGKIKGIDTSNRNRSKIQDILNKLEPKLNTTVEVKKNLIIIHVPKGEEKPYGCPGGFFMRVGANSQKMTRSEIINVFKKEGRLNFEELINEKANFPKDFDSEAFKHFLKLSGISPIIKQDELLQNLDCLTSDKKMTNLGVLFFAKDMDFIMNYVIVDCLLFRGTRKVKILNRKQYKGNIIDNIENALAFVERHTNTEYVIDGKPRREEIPDYPQTALRETIINAVCHRDYFERRCHVVIEVFSNRVEVYNPGGLPSGLDPKKFGTKSVPRNPLIASMLHRANYIEQAGTGIGRIKEAVKKHKKKIQLGIQYSDDSLFYSVTFRKGELAKTAQETTQKKAQGTTQETTQETTQKKAQGTTQETTQETTQKKAQGTTQETTQETTQKKAQGTTQETAQRTTQKAAQGITQKILGLIDKDPFITTQELSKEIGGITPDGVKYHLNKLKKQGLLKRIGAKKNGSWKVVKK